MLKGIAFPSNELVAPDARLIFSVSPISVSPNGQLSVVDVLYSNDSGLSHAFMLVDLTDGNYLTNYNKAVGLGDITSIKASSASVAWSADMVPTVVVSYEDLSDPANIGKDNRIGLVIGTTTSQLDLIETASSTVSNGSIQNLIVEKSGRYVAFETAATNLSPIGTLDTNGLSDVYLLDTLTYNLMRISVLEDGADAPADDSKLQDIALINDKISILFSTAAKQIFSAQDSNTEDDLYFWRDGEISLISSNSAGVAEGYNGGLAGFVDDEIALVATDLINSDTDGISDLYLVNTSTMEKRINSVVDALTFTSDHEVWIEGNNSSEIILGFRGVAQNSIDLSNQLLGVNTETNDSSIYTFSSSGSLANDISDTVALSDTVKTIVYRTSATNLAAQDSLGFVVNHSNSSPHGALTILGSAKLGRTVSVDLNGFSDVDGIGDLSYQWQADGTDIPGATFSSLTLGRSELGKTVTVTVSYVDGFGTAETITSEATDMVSISASLSTDEDTATAVIAFSGSDIDGDTLTFSFSDPAKGSVVDNGNGTFAYTPDANANGSDSFVITANDGTVDVIETINVTIAAVNDAPTITTTTALTTDEDTLTAAIAFSGSDVDGDTLTFSFSDPAKGSVVDNGDGTFTYTPDANANGSDSFTITANDGTVDVTETVNVAIAAVDDFPNGAVTISGASIQGNTLTAVTSTISDEDGLGEFSYQWFSDDVLIVEASDSILKLSQSEVDKVIAVKVNYTDGYGKVEELMSSDSGAVVNVNDAPYGFVTISGTAIEGNTLTADTSRLSDKDGLGEFSYQWFADDVEIPNATESTFILNQSEVDKAITVKVSYTDSYGTAEEFISSTSNLI
ncbi:cadherin-like domain-containing protein, partial [bacterium]|nr:cadherin-like domain-containing protein [bacterium]